MAALYWRIVGRPDYAMDCLRIAMEYADDDNKVCLCVCFVLTNNFFYTHTPLEFTLHVYKQLFFLLFV